MKKEKVNLFTAYFVTSLCIIFLSVIEASSQNTKPTVPTTLPEVLPPVGPEVSPTPTPTPTPNYPMGTGIGYGTGRGGIAGGGGPSVNSGNGIEINFKPPIKKGPFKWQEIATKNKFLSIAMPTNTEEINDKTEYVLDSWGVIKVTEQHTVTGYLNDTSLMFETYKSNKPKEAMYELAKIHFTSGEAEAKCNEIINNDVQGIQCKRQAQKSYLEARYFFDKETVYVAMSASKDKNNPILKQFLYSLRINPEQSKAINEELREDIPLDENKAFKPNEVTQKASIVWNSPPVYTMDARKNQVQGVLRISAILGADGIVRHVRAISNLPDGLTDRAISAAKRIRFFPALKDGKRVSQYVTLEYNFRIY